MTSEFCLQLCESALAELRSTTCGFEAVLFTLFHSRVAGQEACSLQGSAEVLIQEKESSCNAVTDSAGLAGNAAACNLCFNINLAQGTGGNQGLTNDELKGFKAEVIVNVSAIDGDHAGTVGNEVNAGVFVL